MGTPGVVHDWTARIHFKKYELGGSFAVMNILGDVPGDGNQWRTSSSYVGGHYAFVISAANQYSNCRKQVDIVERRGPVVEGFVHLNLAIAKNSGLNSYEPEKFIICLKESLHWRVQDQTATKMRKRKRALCSPRRTRRHARLT